MFGTGSCAVEELLATIFVEAAAEPAAETGEALEGDEEPEAPELCPAAELTAPDEAELRKHEA